MRPGPWWARGHVTMRLRPASTRKFRRLHKLATLVLSRNGAAGELLVVQGAKECGAHC